MKNLLLTLCLLHPLAASALPITVDPAIPLTGTFSVEWNSAGNFESWTTSQVTSATVSGGILSGTTSGTDPLVSRSNIASGPDLDLGFNDYLELRIQLPTSYADNIGIYYGTTGTTGFSGDRIITIPNATIPKDGGFHTYRIDVGPEPWWRANLRDLRVDPGNVSGVAFAIDYLRVGDEPNPTVYQSRFTTKCPAAAGATPGDAYFGPGQAVSSMESKHFRFLWNNNVTTQPGWNANMAKGTLRNLEEAWQVYVKILGYREPAYNVGTTSGTAYKLNVTSYYNGYWAGLDDHGGLSLAQLNITPGGLQVDPPTWVIPHELMHCFQFHNTSGNVNGEWFETHANYGRERWLQHFQVLYPNRSNIEALGVRDGHFMMSSGRNYYLTWPFMYYVDTNPDNLPDLSEGMIKRVWQETQPGEFAMTALDRITPTTSLKDLSGYYARRCATWDFSNQTAMTTELNLPIQDPTRNARHLFTDLIQRPDAPTWWRVPPNKAPAQGAYAMHELIPAGSGAGRVVTVNLQGLADSARGADWRASLIAVSDTGVERYTPLWNNGSSSITLATNENKLYLSVAGTPDVFHYGGHDESIYRFRSHPSRSRFHYQVQVTGATPRERNNGSTSGLTQHSNGNGWKSVTVPASVYIGPNARVTGGSVSGNARIEDYAVVSGGTVNSSAVISGHAWVRGGTVTGDARVRDWAIVDSGTISGNARVLEHATVAANMQDTAVAKGSALHQSGGVLSGNAIIDGDYMFNKSLSNGVTFGHLPFVGIPDNFTTATPAGFYAAYNFRSAHDSRALDQYGVTDGFTTGSPAWTFTDGKRKGFLTFNGSSQSITLDRSVADSRAFSFAAWVKPAGGPANQAVLWLGTTPTRRLSLTTSDSSGQTKFSIVNGGAEQTLTTTALPVGVWSHIAVTLDGTTGVLYVNGSAAASGPITIRPDQLLAANTTTGTQHNYLARAEGSAMPMFQGSLDDAQFFSSALTSTQLSAATVPLLGGIGTLLLSDNFNTGSYSVGEFNNTLAADQQGFLAPTIYTVTSGGQGWQAQHGNGGTMLLVGDAGYGSTASLNEDFSIAANGLNQPLSFQFDATVSDTTNGDCWSSFAIGSRQNLIAPDSGAKFGILPKLNGGMEVWVNGSLQPLASRSGNSYRIVLSDTAGTGSAFNGNGSKAALFNGATLVGTYPLPQLAPGDGYLSFGANPYNGSYNITRIDNLSVSRVLTAVTWQGDTSTDFNTTSNYQDDFWAEWTNYVFDSNAVSGTINVDANTGWGNLSLNSGLATDIVIGGTSPIIMAPVKLGQPGWDVLSLGGTISIASDSKNLTIGNTVLIAGGLVWNVGPGRTLTANGSVQDWTGQGVASLEKQGAGTAVLTGNNSYTGATTVSGGTLLVDNTGTLGSGNLAVANNAVCELRNTSGGVADNAAVTLIGTGRLNLASGVTETVGTLVIDGIQQARGTWNATRDPVHFTGTGALLVTNGPAPDVDGAWTSLADGVWNQTGSWQNSDVAKGADKTATFNQSTGATITVDGSRTIGHLVFGGSDYRLVGDALTLASTSGTSTISVAASRSAFISAVLTGSVGLHKTGDGTLALGGANSYAGATTVSAGTLRVTADTTAGVTIANAGFESPVFGDGGWSYTPSGADWSFNAGGIGRNGSPWVTNAPEGLQAGFVQNNGTLSQSLTVTAGGFYDLTFKAANRPSYPDSGIAIQIDGVTAKSYPAGTFASGGAFQTFVVRGILLEAGSRILTFAGSQNGGDSATAIDAVSLTGYAAGSLPASTALALSGGTLQLDVAQTAGTLTGVSGAQLVNHVALTVGDATDTAFAGVISGSGDLVKTGTGTLSLTGTNTYTGNTTVNGGTLRLGNGTSPANLANTADVTVAPDAMLHLDYTGTDIIMALWVDGSQLPPGVYSSSSGFITGSGTLTVTTGPASSDYATWSGRGVHDLSGAPSDDDDDDGIANLLEYVLSGNPRTASSGILPTATESSDNLVFTFRRIQSSTADTTQFFQYGTNLSGWTDVPVVAGGIVAIQPDTPQAGTDTVTITVPEGTEPRIFGRLKVSAAPAQP